MATPALAEVHVSAVSPVRFPDAQPSDCSIAGTTALADLGMQAGHRQGGMKSRPISYDVLEYLMMPANTWKTQASTCRTHW